MRTIKCSALLAALAMVFCAVAALFGQVIPGPLGPLDAVVIGAGATLVCQLVLFGFVAGRRRHKGH